MHVSVIIPIYNGGSWIDSCFRSILNQSAIGRLDLEICVCNDSSTDNTNELLLKWKSVFKAHGIALKVFQNVNDHPSGVGFGKNRAVSISAGEYLCFQDIDDIMLPNRILFQYQTATNLSNDYIIGSKFNRYPENSTIRYTKWANNISQDQLYLEIYTSHGPTIIMPTWFCHRDVFARIGGFSEGGKGTPEDLIFFYAHLQNNGKLYRLDEQLIIYTYHLNATTFSVNEHTIWKLRLEHLLENVLKHWDRFTIWNAGKQGRRFYKSLPDCYKSRVIAFCDVDPNKINKHYVEYENRKVGQPVDIIYFQDASAPFVICVKLDMTGGEFESNLQKLQLTEGKDYILFC